MEKWDDENLYIRVMEFGRKHPKGFEKTTLLTDAELNCDESEKDILQKHFDFADRNGNFVNRDVPFPFSNSLFLQISSSRYNLSYDAYFSYLDYLELKEARTAATSAKWIAWISIILSAMLAIASILIQWFGSVSLDRSQLNRIEKAIQSTSVQHDVFEGLI